MRPQTSGEAASSLRKIGFDVFVKLGALILAVAVLAQLAREQFYAPTLMNAVVLVAAGYGVGKFQSRLSALTLAGVFSLSTFETFVNPFRVTWHGWFFLVIHASLALLGVGAFQISIKYHRLRGSRLILKNVFMKNLLAGAYFIVISIPVVSIFGRTLKQLGYVEQGFVTFVLSVLVMVLAYAGYLPFTRNRPFVAFKD